MRLLGGGIRPRMAWTHRDVAEAQLVQNAADTALVQHHKETGQNELPQITQTPAHNPMFGRIGTATDPLRQHRFLLVGELGRRPAAMRLIRQPRYTLLVVADNPVAQGLAIHPAVLRRFRTRTTLQNQCDRQQPADHLAIRLGRSKRP